MCVCACELHSKLIIVHHLLCVALILSAWWYPVGGSSVIFASMELELGTATYNLRTLSPVCVRMRASVRVGVGGWV